MMAESLNRRAGVLALAVAAAAMILARPVDAQTPNTTAEEEPGYVAVLTADKVYIRSGAANSYYPFGMLREDAMVRVLEEKYNWARVVTLGPAFEDMFGYVKQNASENRLLKLNADGTRGVTLGRVNVIAANLETGNSPQHSWKPIAHLDPDTEVRVLNTIESDSQIVYAVALPEHATGWVSMAHLRPADEAEQRQWKKLLDGPAEVAEKSAQPPLEKPTVAKNQAARPTTPATTPAVTEQTLAREEPQRTPVVTPPAVSPKPIIEQPATQTPTDARPTAAEQDESAADAAGAAADQATPKPNIAANQPTERATAPTNDARDTAVKSEPEKGVTKAPRTPTQRLEALEAAFERLREEPIETAEVDVLRELFDDLIADAAQEKQVVMYARARAEQLRIWSDLQTRRRELKRLRSQIDVASEDVQSVRHALLTSGSYAAVGRIAASTVYDGTQLPQLYRVQDPGTGRTIAYLRPQKKLDLVGMLDQLVGIVGQRRYDGSLQLHIIEPERIDLLAPQPEQVTGSSDSAGG